MKNNVRELNGYRLLFEPEHPRAMKNENWDGYVYEHIAVAEEYLGRPLASNEIVHHLDGDRANNRHENLLVIERGQHSKLHAWLSAGALYYENIQENGENSLNVKVKPVKSFCSGCGKTLQAKQLYCCSSECYALFNRKVIRPSKEVLAQEVSKTSLLQLSKKYGVSDNAIRKWMKAYNLTKPTRSRAKDTSLEGSETTGEVEPS